MKCLARLFAHLYPAPWSERYGDELNGLIDDAPGGWRQSIDVLAGAAKMQMSSWSFWEITTACAAMGVFLMGTVAFSLPDRWTSRALLAVSSDREGLDALGVIEESVLNATTLVGYIQHDDLYRGERSRQPLYDVLDNMRRHIPPVPAQQLSPAIFPFEIRFEYPDRMVASQT